VHDLCKDDICLGQAKIGHPWTALFLFVLLKYRK